MGLTMGEKIRILIRRKGITISELANMINSSSQNLSNKLSRDNFSEKELQQIAQALGCSFQGYFIDEQGDRI